MKSPKISFKVMYKTVNTVYYNKCLSIILLNVTIHPYRLYIDFKTV